MPYSILRDTFTGGPQVFPVNFTLGIIHESHIRVYVEGEVDGSGTQLYRDFTYDKRNQRITVTSPLTPGSVVYRTRTVPKEELLAWFTNGADVTKKNLDIGSTHLMHAIHEILDGRISSIEELDGLYDLLEDFEIVRDQMQDAADRAEAAASLLDPAWQFNSTVYLRTHNFNGTPPEHVRVLGYSDIGDGGETLYHRRASAPVHGVYETSADGVIWEVANVTEWDARIFGFGGTTNVADLGKAIRFADAMGGGLVKVPAGVYPIASSLSFTNIHNVTIQGAGKFVTRIERSTAGLHGMAFTLCTNLNFSDFTLDCNRTSLGPGSHGLRFDRCSRVSVRDVNVEDWSDTGIIFMDSTSIESYWEHIIVENCYLDGKGAANNGILFACVRDGLMRNNTVKDLGRVGDPCFGQQLKLQCEDCFIHGATVINARAGVAVGNGDSPSRNCVISDCVLIGCMRAVRVTSSQYITVRNIVIDMANAEDLNPLAQPPLALYLRFSSNCSITGLIIRNYTYAGNPVISIGQSQENYIEIDQWRNVPWHNNFLLYDTGAVANVVILGNYVGQAFDFLGNMITYTTGSINNTTRRQDGPHAANLPIVAGAITLRDYGINRVRLDTESLASADDLVTINGGYDGMRIVMTTTNDARDVTVKAVGGNISPANNADRTLGLRTDCMSLTKNSFVSKWLEE